MTTRLLELLSHNKCGIVAIAENMKNLKEVWDLLKIPEDKKKVWNLIADPTNKPMKIELVLNDMLSQFKEHHLGTIWIKYGNFPNRTKDGKYMSSRIYRRRYAKNHKKISN